MRPENTIPAFEYAIAAGVDALELDMAVTKDNVIVVSHDPILHPPVCSGPQPAAVIHQLTLAEVKKWDCGLVQNPDFKTQQNIPGTRMPTLDEVFDLAPKGKFKFNIETKSFPKQTTRTEAEGMLALAGQSTATPEGRAMLEALMAVGPNVTPPPDEFVKLVLAKVRQHHLEDRVILQSFDFRTLREMRKIAPEIPLSALFDGRAPDYVAVCKDAGNAEIASPSFQGVTAEKVRQAHAAGIQVIPWTADKTKDWDALIAAGVDAIISDDPADLIAYLKTHH